MVQAVWFDRGAERPGRLLLAIHHLAVDGVSWRILVPDLAAAWQAIAAGEPAALPRAGRRSGAGRSGLSAQAQDAARGGGAFVLARRCWSEPSLLLLEGGLDARARRRGHGRASDADAAGGGDGGAADAGAGGVPWRHQRRAADGACAGGGGLVPAARRRRCAAAAALRCCSTSRATAARRCSAPSICRGRWAGSPASIRCGWICGRSIWRRRWRAERRSGGRSSAIKEQLRAVPRQGAGLRAAALSQRGRRRRELAGFAAPQLGFNYLGRFAGGRAATRLGGGERRARGLRWRTARRMPLAHAIEINALTLDGAAGPRLAANWTLGAGAARRGCGARSGGGLVRGACGAGAPCGAAGRGRPHPERSAAGCV